jgi:hypothetical protein
MRHSAARTTVHWISTFVNVTLHSCSPAQAADISGPSVVATIPGNAASFDYPPVDRTRCSYSEGRSQRLTMTRHSGRTVIGIWQPALGSGAMATPAPLILKSTVIQDRSQNSSLPNSPFAGLLMKHCETIVASGRSQSLIVQLELRFEGICPATHEKTVLRVVDELLSNAMEHGFYGRQRGHVFVHVVSRAAVGVQVSVSDDGWGFDSGPMIDGNGFHLLRQIGDLHIGAAAGPLVAKTAVTVLIPLHRCRAAASPAAPSRH